MVLSEFVEIIYSLIYQASHVESYPLPLVEDIFVALLGGKSFTKLDLANAFLQLEVEENNWKNSSQSILIKVCSSIHTYHLECHLPLRSSREQLIASYRKFLDVRFISTTLL